jgi:DNA-binding MarR family transcriptional regulator
MTTATTTERFNFGVVRHLTGSDSDILLDAVANLLYVSPMKQMHHEEIVREDEEVGTPAGATLFTFLDVSERLFSQIAEALKAVGLSYAKYDILDQLRRADQPVSLRVLAQGLGCAASNITQLMDRLEAEQLVQRVDDPEDRRSVRAQLTPQGAIQAEEGLTQIDVVRAKFAASFTAAERVELARLLAKIR